MDSMRKRALARSQWKWFGYAGHLCVSDQCLFTMATQVGNYLISTVGDYRRYHRGDMAPLGSGREDFFETAVFPAGHVCNMSGCGCEMPDIGGGELDMERCSTAGEAQKIHIKYCEKYSRYL